MKKLVLIDHKKNTRETMETALTVKAWASLVFGGAGFCALRFVSPTECQIIDTVTKEAIYTITAL